MSAQPTLHTPALQAQAARLAAELHPEPDYNVDPEGWRYYIRQIAHAACKKRGLTNTYARTEFLKEATKVATAKGYMGNKRGFLRIISQQLKARGYGKKVYASQKPIPFDNPFYAPGQHRLESRGPFGEPSKLTPEEIEAKRQAALAQMEQQLAQRQQEREAMTPVTDQTAAPTTNELREYVPRTDDNQPAPHWIDDKDNRARYWATVKKYAEWTALVDYETWSHTVMKVKHTGEINKPMQVTLDLLLKDAIMERYQTTGIKVNFQRATNHPTLNAAIADGLNPDTIMKMIDDDIEEQHKRANDLQAKAVQAMGEAAAKVVDEAQTQNAPETPTATLPAATPAISIPEAATNATNRPVEAKETIVNPVPAAPEITLPPQTSAIIPFDPSRAIAQAKMYADTVRALRSDGVLKEGKDFGKIPGAGDKATLFKAGAEKLCNAFGFCPRFVLIDKVINWSPAGPLFYFQYECQLVNIETGKVVATGIGSCNSMESKYRYRWLWKNQLDDLGLKPDGLTTRKTKNGQTQYRIDNDDVFSQVNTLDKMAQKRALVAATLIGANASEHFSQDLEDLPQFGYVDAESAA